MDKSTRNPMPTQVADERINNFNEVALGYTAELATAEANRCLGCKNAPCRAGCPVGVRIPEFISEIKKGNIDGAAEALFTENNLPAICGRVCPQESQCEKYCVRREKLGGSVGIGYLERYVADYALDIGLSETAESNTETEYKRDLQREGCLHHEGDSVDNSAFNSDICRESSDTKSASLKFGARVAVVGSGPAGLSCAADLAKAGVEVVVYEALHKAGGVLVYGIPEFRLPKDLVQKEIDRVTSLGVKIETDTVVGKTVLIDELLSEFDAVFIGSGAGLPQFLRIKGENLGGVYSANEYLTRVNLMKAYLDSSVTPVHRGNKVVVIGAGNVAMDAARTARRLGAEVNLVYRRSRAEMPARAEEVEHAEEEGIIFNLLTNPVEILGENGFVRGIKCVRMELGELDASGRRSPVEIKDSDFEIECDEVIVALGTSPNPIIKNSFPSLTTSRKGTLVADENGKTSVPRVYTGGDAMTGAATVILAMGAGKRAASAILNELRAEQKR